MLLFATVTDSNYKSTSMIIIKIVIIVITTIVQLLPLNILNIKGPFTRGQNY